MMAHTYLTIVQARSVEHWEGGPVLFFEGPRITAGSWDQAQNWINDRGFGDWLVLVGRELEEPESFVTDEGEVVLRYCAEKKPDCPLADYFFKLAKA